MFMQFRGGGISHKVSREWDTFLQSDCQTTSEEASDMHGEEGDTMGGIKQSNEMSREDEDKDELDLLPEEDEEHASDGDDDNDESEDEEGEVVASLDDHFIMSGQIKAMTVNMLQDVLYLEVDGTLSSWDTHYFSVNITTPGRKQVVFHLKDICNRKPSHDIAVQTDNKETKEQAMQAGDPASFNEANSTPAMWLGEPTLQDVENVEFRCMHGLYLY
ncbi:hypothetical protein EDC04DRAFT_2893513 [Pisolithus marmoratus]|nr:hypothetical protein EDC04DRAFT_2893513 [Pisolithus marmoratus]